jgi:enamine deaminase RidA (YjgF/YER057c/UK114 family)
LDHQIPVSEEVPIETIVHSPTNGVYAPTADYAHAIEVRESSRFLFVAGTMGLDPQGVAGKSLDEQLDLVWNNLRAILAAANMTVDNIVRATSYLRDASSADANGAARVAALDGRVIPTTAIVAETLVDDWLVEIEVIAAE